MPTGKIEERFKANKPGKALIENVGSSSSSSSSSGGSSSGSKSSLAVLN